MNELTFTLSQIPTLQNGDRFKAVPDSWDLNMPIGYGRTIDEAIESLLESWELHYDVVPKYTWR